MAAKLEILLLARDLNASSTLTKVKTEVTGVGTAVAATEAKLKAAGSGASAFASKLDAAGRNARIGLGAVTQFAGSAAAGLGNISREAGMIADAVGDLAGSFVMLGPIGLALTGISLAIGAVITLMQQQEREAAAALERVRQYEEGLRQTYESARAALNELTPKEDPFKNVAASIPLAVAKLRELAQTSEEARDKLNRLLTSQEGARVLEDRLARLQVQLRELNELAQQQVEAKGVIDPETEAQLQGVNNLIRVYTEALNGAREAEAQLKSEILGEASAHDAATAAAARHASALAGIGGTIQDARFEAQDYGVAVAGADVRVAQFNAEQDRLKDKLAQQDEAFQKAQQSAKQLAEQGYNAARAAAERFKSSMMSLVKSVLAPTQVTDADMAAAAMGKYVDKWDELARQADDVNITPENIAKYEQLAAALQQTGMSAGEFANAFRNMSLFADPANLNLVNWEAVTAQIKDKIRGMIGEANLMKEAFRQAVASLSPSEMRAFANAMDLDPSAANNVDKLFEAYTSKEAGEATTTLGDMASKIQIIEGTKTTTLNFVWEKAKAAIDEANAYLEEKILQYGDVLIEITAKFNPPPPPDTGGTGADGGGKAVGGAVFADTSYVVGEHGPEIFVPKSSGTIIPNSRTQNFGGITVSGNTFVIQSDFDMRRFAAALNQQWGRRIAMRSAMRI